LPGTGSTADEKPELVDSVTETHNEGLPRGPPAVRIGRRGENTDPLQWFDLRTKGVLMIRQ
jgi:hypothetical protein